MASAAEALSGGCTPRLQGENYNSWDCPNRAAAVAIVTAAPIPPCWVATGTVGPKEIVHQTGSVYARVRWGPGCGRGYYDWSDGYALGSFPQGEAPPSTKTLGGCPEHCGVSVGP